MNIGEVAKASGVSAKMIRYYESTGLLPEPRRSLSGYRIYNENDIHILRFIRQSRKLGFPVEKIRDLLKLWQNQRRKSVTVKKLAAEHIAELDESIRDLQEIRSTLQHLIDCCHGDDRPECPILEGLSNA